MSQNLISQLLLRKVSLIFNYGFLAMAAYIFLTWKLDTRLFEFELRTVETAKWLYDTYLFEKHVGKYLYEAYNYVVTDWILWKVLQGAILGFGLSYYFITKVTIKEGVKYLRGSKLVSPEDLKKQIKSKGERSRLTISKTNIPIPYFDENRGFALFGKPGGGKTQALLNLILQIITFKETMIIYDRKPDFWTRFYRKDQDYLFYPDDQRSIRWNIFDDISDDIGYKLSEIDLAVKSFIPERPENKDPFWDNAARLILKAIMLKIKDSKKPSNKALIDFIRTYKTREELYEQLQDIEEEYGVPINELLTEAAKTTGGAIMMNLQPSFDKVLKNVFYYEEGNFSIKKFIQSNKDENQDVRLFLVQTKKEDGQYEAYFRLMIDIMIREILTLPNSQYRRIWTLLDEFQTLGKLFEIIEKLTEGRSKGSCPGLATQSLAQVREIYGENNMETIFQALSTKIIHQYDEPRGAKMLTGYFGEQEVEERTPNRMVTADKNRDITQIQTKVTTKKVLLEGEFSNLDPYKLEAYIKISNFDAAKISFKYQDIEPEHFLLRDVHKPFIATSNVRTNAPAPVKKAVKEDKKEEKKKQEEERVPVKIEQKTEEKVNNDELAILKAMEGDNGYER